MTRQALFQAIDRGAYESVYFFYGPEEWIKESAVRRLRKGCCRRGSRSSTKR
jgi:DNA polymerase III delta subunit